MARRALAIAACALLLAGCESFGDLTSDAFDPGKSSQSRFLRDSALCKDRAEVKRSYEFAGIAGSHAERHEIFNRAYTACMVANGYPPRDRTLDPTFPYNVDPWPG